ncbi:MAG: hypothetical protein ABIR91_05265 [Candidatus Saccharimonadales bacterium]
MKTSHDKPKNLISAGFELDKNLNKFAIVAGLGVAAVGSIIAAPAVLTFGAATVAGSAAGMAISDRLQRGYDKYRTS